MRRLHCLAFALALSSIAFAQNDEEYGKKIKEYTTETFFSTELVDHLPASSTVPSPLKHFGTIIGAPDRLHYVDEINAYMRAVDRASPRVVVESMGKSEGGREMIVVVISSEENLARLDRLKQINGLLGDPRQLVEGGYKGDGKMPGADAAADKLIQEAVPFYYATAGMHSPEAGPPEMVMELVYRLAVSEEPFIKAIRDNSVVMVTPVLDTDGRDRYVDTYHYRKKNPGKNIPLVYWGQYVAHDNNRDNMGLALALSKNLMHTWAEFKPLVMHDLHESVPYLYISTGTGPYNAWLDPITVDEWHIMAYHEVDEMTKRGVPGVWTHGFYDGWAPNYAFYAANGHNAIGRFYETQGGTGADTRVINVGEQSNREWFRPNPPFSKIKWSLRNNTNLMESAILIGMNNTAQDKEKFLRNYYLKSKRSVLKPWNEGPAAYVIPKTDKRVGLRDRLVKLLQSQGVEATVLLDDYNGKDVKLQGGDVVIRMDQPYSRMADMLLDKQYFRPSDPQPYDDTGWTLGSLFNLDVRRVKDSGVLAQRGFPKSIAEISYNNGPIDDHRGWWIIEPSGDPFFPAVQFRDGIEVTTEDQEIQGKKFPAGSYVVPAALLQPGDTTNSNASAFGSLGFVRVTEKPKLKTRLLAKPRVAVVHTWTSTQDEGWVRLALDELKVPYKYVSVHELRDTADLRKKYDVILMAPTGGSSQTIVNGLAMVGDKIPWKPFGEFKHLGGPDQSDDIRGGIGLEGMLNLQKFIEAGGLAVFMGSTCSVPIDYGIVRGVSTVQPKDLFAPGSVFLAERVSKTSPVLYGYDDTVPVYFDGSILLTAGGGGFGFGGGGAGGGRPSRVSGRGDVRDPDVVQGRPAPPEVANDPATPQGPQLPRPEVLLRFAPLDKLLISGGLDHGDELAGKAALVRCPVGKGNVILFALNPMWRHETMGSWQMVVNAMTNWNSLNVPEPPTPATPATPRP